MRVDVVGRKILGLGRQPQRLRKHGCVLEPHGRRALSHDIGCGANRGASEHANRSGRTPEDAPGHERRGNRSLEQLIDSDMHDPIPRPDGDDPNIVTAAQQLADLRDHE